MCVSVTKIFGFPGADFKSSFGRGVVGGTEDDRNSFRAFGFLCNPAFSFSYLSFLCVKINLHIYLQANAYGKQISVKKKKAKKGCRQCFDNKWLRSGRRFQLSN